MENDNKKIIIRKLLAKLAYLMLTLGISMLGYIITFLSMTHGFMGKRETLILVGGIVLFVGGGVLYYFAVFRKRKNGKENLSEENNQVQNVETNESKEPKKKNVKSIISNVISIVVALIVIVIGLDMAGIIGGNSNHTSTKTRLKAPTNLAYDEVQALLTWDEVENANMYKVSINDEIKEVETNYYTFMPTKKESTIKVRSIDKTGEYEFSSWSKEITYTIPDDVITPQSVFAFVSKLDRSRDLVNIASLYIKDGLLYSKCHVIKYNNKDKVIFYITTFETPVTTLEEAMNTKILGTVIRNEYDYSEYKSAEYFIKSREYVGQMEEYRKDGYTFEVVSSETIDKGVNLPMIYGTYRLTKGEDVKYIESSIDFCLENPSTSKGTNYTTKLQITSERSARELSFHELTGDFYEWADTVYKNKQKSAKNKSGE